MTAHKFHKLKPFTEYFLSLKPGEIFYTGMMDKDITNLSCRYKRKVSTKRILGIHADTKSISDIVEVTIII